MSHIGYFAIIQKKEASCFYKSVYKIHFRHLTYDYKDMRNSSLK